MRLFIAIDIPTQIKEYLSSIQESFDVPLKRVLPKNIHLTLNFLGDYKDAASVVEKLYEVNFAPFTLKLNEAGFFPDEIDPKVVWVGLKDNKALFSLQKDIDLFFTPKRSFKPHLTLARVGKLSNEEKIKLVKYAQGVKVKPLEFSVQSFRLYKSTLTQFGPIYEAVETFNSKVKV